MWPLDARHVADWLQRYNRARMSYIRGVTNAEVARKLLGDLRFRDEALRIEMLEWERAKRKRRAQQHRSAYAELADYIGPSSS